MFIEKHYPLKLFLRQYIINLQLWLKLVWCQRRFKRDFPVVSPFKNLFLPQIQHDKVIYKRHGLNEHERVLGPRIQSTLKNTDFLLEIHLTLAIASGFALQSGNFSSFKTN